MITLLSTCYELYFIAGSNYYQNNHFSYNVNDQQVEDHNDEDDKDASNNNNNKPSTSISLSLLKTTTAIPKEKIIKFNINNNKQKQKNIYYEYFTSFSAISNTRQLFFYSASPNLFNLDDDDDDHQHRLHNNNNNNNNDPNNKNMNNYPNLNSVGFVLFVVILIELLIRSYLQPLFLGMITMNDLLTGIQHRLLNGREFFFIRCTHIVTCIYLVIL